MKRNEVNPVAQQRYRKRKRKTVGRFILKTMSLGFMCLAVIMGATIFFKVETILVEGNSHYTEEEIIAATNIHLGENLFSIQKENISEQITYVLPYIQAIEIKLHLPTGIKLVVQEQMGMVELVTDDGTWYMGIQGKLLENTSTAKELTPFPPEEATEGEPSTSDAQEETTLNEEENAEENVEILGEGTVEPLVAGEDHSLSSLNFASAEDTVTQLISDVIPWEEEQNYDLEFDPHDQPVITVTGLTPVDPQPGEQIQVSEEDQRQLSALLSLFSELQALELFQDVTTIHVDKFNYFEFNYGNRFQVKLPFSGDFNYKLRALLSAVADRESYETGMMDLTQEQYAVLFTPD